MRQLSDSTGTLTLGQSFEPYGDLLKSAGTGNTSFGFTGEWTDGTGLLNLRTRYLNTGIGRFITRDVWSGNPQRPLSLNRWIYVEGNPIIYTDPNGEWVWIPLATLAGAVVGGLTYYATNKGESFDSGELAVAMVGGAVAGALISTGVGLIAAGGSAAIATVLTGAGVGGGASGLAYTASHANEFKTSSFVATSVIGGAVGAVSSGASLLPSAYWAFAVKVGAHAFGSGTQYIWNSVEWGNTNFQGVSCI